MTILAPPNPAEADTLADNLVMVLYRYFGDRPFKVRDIKADLTSNLLNMCGMFSRSKISRQQERMHVASALKRAKQGEYKGYRLKCTEPDIYRRPAIWQLMQGGGRVIR